MKAKSQANWRRFFGFGSEARKRRPREGRLGLESLETRRLMIRNVDIDGIEDPPLPPAQKIECYVSKDCFIEGSTGNDRAVISRDGNNVTLTLTYRANNGAFLTTTKTVASVAVKNIHFDAGDGDDTFLNNTDISSEANGGRGNDSLRGGSGADFLYGDADNDLLNGRGGDDVLQGGDGNDSLRGELGTDFLYGGNGPDTLRGGGGDDFLHGQGDIDTLLGDDGRDYLDGGFDFALDSLTGGTDADVFIQHVRFTGGPAPGNVVNAVQNPPVKVGVNGNVGAIANVGLIANLGAIVDQLAVNGNLVFLTEPADTVVDLNVAAGDSLQQHVHESEVADPRFPVPVFLRDGDLRIEGTAASDSAAISMVTLADSVNGVAILPRQFFRVTVNGLTLLYPQSSVTGGDVIFTGRAGNDSLNANVTLRTTANGGDGNDTLVVTRGVNVLRGDAGNDTLTSGSGSDLLDGGAGFDQVNASGGGFQLSDTFLSGTVTGFDSLSGIETAMLVGAASNDRIDASAFTAGAVVLDGAGGDDTLIGTPHNDTLNGGSGNDNVYGRSGQDILQGGSGNDGLYGGQDVDTLTGGSGRDRFLDESWVETKFLVFHERKWRDTITDFNSSQDVRIAFENGGQATLNPAGQPGKYTYAAGTWADNEVEIMDSGLGILHRATGNVRLLKKKNGDLLIFVRHGNLIKSEGGSFSAGAWNDGEKMHFPETVDANDRGTAIHEIGHNWDTEYNQSGWRAVSGWTTSDKSKDANYQKALDSDTTWYYLKSAQFVSNYAKTNPNEDFAESFEAFFMDKGGFSSNINSAPDKKAFMNKFVADMS